MATLEENRYLAYFQQRLESSLGSQASQPDEMIEAILAEIRQYLADSGYSKEIIEAETSLARQAAAQTLKEISGKASAEMAANVAPAATTPRKWLMPGLAVVAVLIYLLPILFFLRESMAGRADHVLAPNEASFEISLVAIDFQKDTATLQLLPELGQALTADGQLAADLDIVVDSGVGVQSFSFKAHTPLLPWSLAVPIDSGDILDFPFDSHSLEIEISGKQNGRPLKVSSFARLAPHGFNLRQATQEASEKLDARLTVSRSGPIVFMVLLATASLVLVTLAALLVAWQVFLHKRRVEFSMLTWSAALLFVVPTVRNGLPGAIPPGALIDFAVYFWLQALAAMAATYLIYAWWRSEVA